MRERYLFRDTVLYGVSSTLARGASIFTAPLLTVALTVSEFGVVDTLQTLMALVLILVGLNVESGVFRLYFEKNEEDKPSLLCTALFFSTAAGLCVAWLAYCFSEQGAQLIFGSVEWAELVLWMLLRVPILLAYIQFILLLQYRHQLGFYLFSQVLWVASHLGVVILLYYGSALDVKALIYWQTLAQGGVVLFLAWSLRKSYWGGSLRWDFLREIVSFSLPQLPAVILSLVLLGTLPLFLTRIVSSYAAGIYAVASKIAMVYGFVLYSFRRAYDPVLAEAMGAQDEEWVARVVKKGVGIYLLLLLPLGLVGLTVPFAFPYVVDAKFGESVGLIPLLCLGVYLTVFNHLLAVGILYSKQTKYLSYAQAVAFAFFVCLAYPVMSHWGYWGATGLFVGASVVQNLLTHYYSQQQLVLSLPLSRVFGLAILLTALAYLPLAWSAVRVHGGD